MEQTLAEYARIVKPETFEPENHWYARALNAQIHPLVAFFMHLDANKIISRYCHLNPRVNAEKLHELLSYRPHYFLHAGADLFHVTDEFGNRNMVIIETNSSPSGQKSMPLLDETNEQGGYRTYMANTFKPFLKSRKKKIEGKLAVVYDKNPMEAAGYASAMADVFQEPVFFVPFMHYDQDPPVRFVDNIMEVRDEAGQWHQIRAAFRYVTQKPWNRIPIYSRTVILNPIIACLAGGRNKMVAAKAYDFFNAELAPYGLQIKTPETIWDVKKAEIPLWVKKLGGQAVVKIPYANAGQGVFTLVNEQELDAFMEKDFPYDMFIVQSLIGNYHWSSQSAEGKFYHVGTMPTKRNQSFVADVRMMVTTMSEGLRPVAIYARRARMPLVNHLESGQDSWDVLGTNLSILNQDGSFGSDTNRLMMMDRKDFNKLGISVDEMIEGYIQTVLALIAIDKMAEMLINSKGRLKTRLFRSLNDDEKLMDEIVLES